MEESDGGDRWKAIMSSEDMQKQKKNNNKRKEGGKSIDVHMCRFVKNTFKKYLSKKISLKKVYRVPNI